MKFSTPSANSTIALNHSTKTLCDKNFRRREYNASVYGDLTRTPMEGELFSVLKEQIGSITAIAQSDNRPMSSGNVTITVGNTETESLDVTTALRFESYREYDDFQKNIIANDSYTVRFDSIASKCKSVSVNLCEIIKSVEGITEGFSGTY